MGIEAASERERHHYRNESPPPVDEFPIHSPRVTEVVYDEYAGLPATSVWDRPWVKVAVATAAALVGIAIALILMAVA